MLTIFNCEKQDHSRTVNNMLISARIDTESVKQKNEKMRVTKIKSLCAFAVYIQQQMSN